MLIVTTISSSVYAFDYTEHFDITRSAISALRAEQTLGSVDLFLTSVREWLDPDYLCADAYAFEGNAKSACIALPDLPALSGDHAATPITLIGRWFRRNVRARRAFFLNVLGYFKKECDPESRLTADELLSLLHSEIGKAVRLKTSERDSELNSGDGDYACLAGKNYNHFRIKLLDPQAAISKPVPNAVAEYARYHGQALIFAMLAMKHVDNGKYWRGLAALSEFFALHFLEDSVAAGHIVTPRFSERNEIDYSTGTVKKTHDFYNHRGIRVRVPIHLCNELERFKSTHTDAADQLPRLIAICSSPVLAKTAMLRGDGAIDDGSVRKNSADITFEAAKLLVWSSLRQVWITASTDKSIVAVSDRCEKKVTSCLAPGTEAASRKCFEVFGSEECQEPKIFFEELADNGSDPVIAELPTEVDTEGLITFFSGNALTASAATIIRVASVKHGDITSGNLESSGALGWAYFTPPLIGNFAVSIGTEAGFAYSERAGASVYGPVFNLWADFHVREHFSFGFDLRADVLAKGGYYAFDPTLFMGYDGARYDKAVIGARFLLGMELLFAPAVEQTVLLGLELRVNLRRSSDKPPAFE